KEAGFLVNVNASLTGNLFEITFDGQSAILGRKGKASPGPLGPQNAWIGQNPDTGFRVIAAWIEPDPGIASPALTLAERRMLLAADGAKLLPGSGVPCGGSLIVGACENGYREAVVWTDVTLPDGPTTAPVDPVRAPPPRFSPSVRVSGPEATPVAQHAPQLAAAGARVYVVWHEARAPLEHVFAAHGRRGGTVFGPAVRVDGGAPVPLATHLDNKWGPTLAASGRSLYAAWADFRNYNWDIFLARSPDRGASWGSNVQVDDFPDFERIDERPSVAADRLGHVHVVWTDLRAREPDTNSS